MSNYLDFYLDMGDQLVNWYFIGFNEAEINMEGEGSGL